MGSQNITVCLAIIFTVFMYSMYMPSFQAAPPKEKYEYTNTVQLIELQSDISTLSHNIDELAQVVIELNEKSTATSQETEELAKKLKEASDQLEELRRKLEEQ